MCKTEACSRITIALDLCFLILGFILCIWQFNYIGMGSIIALIILTFPALFGQKPIHAMAYMALKVGEAGICVIAIVIVVIAVPSKRFNDMGTIIPIFLGCLIGKICT